MSNRGRQKHRAAAEDDESSIPAPEISIAPSSDAAGGDDVAGAGDLLLKPLPFTITMPPRDDFYFVREDQLESLGKEIDSNSFDIALAAGGAAVGLFQNVVAVWKQINTVPQVLNSTDIGLAAMCVGLTVLAVTKYCQYRGQRKGKESLRERIKSGQKATVGR